MKSSPKNKHTKTGHGLAYGLAVACLSGLMMMGCASRENYDATMKSLLGKSKKEVTALLGEPSSEYDLSGQHFLVYRTADLGVAGAGYVVTGQQDQGSVFREGSQGQSFYKKWCQTTLGMKNGVVGSYQAKGNNCRL